MQITSKKSFWLALVMIAGAGFFFISAAQSHRSNMDKFADRASGVFFTGIGIVDLLRAFRAHPARATGNQD
jgi:hypothetical protein